MLHALDAHILEQYRDQVTIAELDTNQDVSDTVDIVLYDTFAQPETDHDEIGVLVRNPHAGHVVVYTWNFQSRPDRQRPGPRRTRVSLQGLAGA